MAREHSLGGRPLQGEERAIGLRRKRGRPAQPVRDIGEVVVLGAGIDDEEQRRLAGRRATMKSSMIVPSSVSSSA